MQRIAFVSPLGGCGRTTLAAHTAAILAQRGLRVLAVDLCPQNALGRHLGLAPPDAPGWLDALANGDWWGQAGLEGAPGLHLLPYGSWAQACMAPTLPGGVAGQLFRAGWLDAQLQALDLPGAAIALLDCPALPDALALQAAQCAHLVVLVLEASARACGWQQRLRAWVAQLPAGTRCAVAITGVDARSPLRAAALHELRQQWSDCLLPYPLHADEHVQQALQQGLCVHQHAPHSQAAHDLQGMADWMAQALGLGPAPKIGAGSP